MKLQILVNHYREPEGVVARLLGSLAAQEGVSWDDAGVLVASDGTDLDSAFLSSFGIPVTHFRRPHGGVCRTRNFLLGRADADYVMFADADDSLHSTLGIHKLLGAIDDSGADVIAAPYDVESHAGGAVRYRTERRDTLHVHAKALRRRYLLDNGIRFPDDMEFGGDMHLLWLALNLGGSVAWMRDPYYVWRDTPGSVTRADPWHRVRTYGSVIACYEHTLADLAARGRDDLRRALVASLFAMAYDQSNDDAYTMAPPDAVAEMASAISAFAARHAGEYCELSAMEKEAALRSRPRRFGTVGDMDRWLGMACAR